MKIKIHLIILIIFFVFIALENNFTYANTNPLVIIKSEGNLCNSSGSNIMLRDWLEEILCEKSDILESIKLKILKLGNIIDKPELESIFEDMIKNSLSNNDEELSEIYNQMSEGNHQLSFQKRVLKKYNIRYIQKLFLMCISGTNYIDLHTYDLQRHLMFKTREEISKSIIINERTIKDILWKLFLNTFKFNNKVDAEIPKFLWDDQLQNRDFFFRDDIKLKVEGKNYEKYKKIYKWSAYKIKYTAKEVKNERDFDSYYLPEKTAIRILMKELVEDLQQDHSSLINRYGEAFSFGNDLCFITANLVKHINKRNVGADEFGLIGPNYYFIVGSIGWIDATEIKHEIIKSKLVFVGHLKKYTGLFQFSWTSESGRTNQDKISTECSSKKFKIVKHDYRY